MAAQVASAPTRTNSKNKKLPSGLVPELGSGKSGGAGGAVQRTGPMLGAPDGTLNNVEHHRRGEHTMVHSTSTSRGGAPDGHDKDGNNLAAGTGSTHPSASSPLETGLIANHKLKCAGSGDPPQPLPSPQQQPQSQFGQFAPHQQRPSNNTTNNNNNNNGQGLRGGDHQHHGGKENLLGGQGEQQHMAGKGEGDLTCKPTERMMGSRYDHSNNSEFNNNSSNYYTPRPCYEQHGGQQQQGGGMGITHSLAHNSLENSQEPGYHNSQYSQYPAYRAGYGGGGGGAYGMMGPAGCRQPGNMLMGNNSSAKSPLGASSAGFQRFPGQGHHHHHHQQHHQQQQHPSGATPTLNQLLTSPSPMMRGYGAGYQDYCGSTAQQQQPQQAVMGLGKDGAPQYGGPASHGWGGQPRNHPHSISAGNGGQALGRSQVSPRH